MTEIERKWCIDSETTLSVIKENPSAIDSRARITQHYIAIDKNGNEVRVRKKHKMHERFAEYTITFKSSGDLSRVENEYQITKDIYQTLIKMSDGRFIKKRRYIIQSETAKDTATSTAPAPLIELDLFEFPRVMTIAEVEFKNVKEANAFVVPKWFGTEVTNDPNYKNKSLATETSDFKLRSYNSNLRKK